MNPLPRAYRLMLYATGAVLVGTGAAWAWLHSLVDERVALPAIAWLMKIHGAAAMLSLVLLGSVLFQHIGAGWRLARNRSSGVAILALSALLAVTGYLLYYAGDERVRSFASLLHLAVGAIAPLLLAVHVLPRLASARSGAKLRADPPY